MNFGEIDGFWWKATPQVAPVTIKIIIENLAGEQTVYEKEFQEAQMSDTLVFDL